MEGGVRGERNPLIAKFWMLLEKGFEALRTVNTNLRRDARLPHKDSERLRKQVSMPVHGRACRIAARNGPTAT